MSISRIAHIHPPVSQQGTLRPDSGGQPSVVPSPREVPGEPTSTDRVSLSQAGRRAAGALGAGRRPNGQELSPEEDRQVAHLKQRDQEVRAHEAAHMSAGSGLAGSANFQYTVGPDGKRYATGGEVPIDVSAEKDPRDTIAKMQQVRRAALAPAQPSSADRAIATQATKTEQQARMTLRQEENAATAEESAPADGVDPNRPVDPSASAAPKTQPVNEDESDSGPAPEAAPLANPYGDPSAGPATGRPSHDAVGLDLFV